MPLVSQNSTSYKIYKYLEKNNKLTLTLKDRLSLKLKEGISIVWSPMKNANLAWVKSKPKVLK